MAYKECVCVHGFNRKKLRKVWPVSTATLTESCISTLYKVMEPDTFFVSEDGGLPVGTTYWVTVLRLKDVMYLFHSGYIITVTEDLISHDNAPDEAAWRKLFIAITPEKLDINHYKYLELVIEKFWQLVFNKSLDEMWCAGIIGAHGDKGRGYDSDWEDVGISFNRGMLIFLLTWTKELKGREKHESCKWVIENYQKYLPMILEAEKDAGFPEV